MFLLYVVGLFVFVTGLTSAHEYAHYRVARRYRIDVTRVVIGAGPIVWSRARSTVWEVRLLPVLGGTYMAGMTEPAARLYPPRPGRRSYIHMPPRVRMLVSSAGSAMNLAVAGVAYTLAALLTSVPRQGDWWAWPLAPYYGLLGVSRSIRYLLDRGWGWVFGATHVDPLTGPRDGTDIVSQFADWQIYLAVPLLLVGFLSITMAALNMLPLYPFDGFDVLMAGYDWYRSSIAQGRYGLRRKPIPRPLTRNQQRWYIWPSAAFAISVVLLPYSRDVIDLLR